jgi:hypothetical protein
MLWIARPGRREVPGRWSAARPLKLGIGCGHQGNLLFVFDPYELSRPSRTPGKGSAHLMQRLGRRAPVVTGVPSSSTRGLRRGAHPWTPPRPRHVAAGGRRCEQPYRLRESGRHGAVLLVPPRARKDWRPGRGVRGCGLWEKRVRLGHWDLRLVLRGRNLSEVRSCCRSEDRPHIDALGHRLYSVRGDTQPRPTRPLASPLVQSGGEARPA